MWEKHRLKTVVSVTAVLILGSVYLLHSPEREVDESAVFFVSENGDECLQTEESRSESTVFFVHVSGEVKNPGVYELAEGDRVCDAIRKAGGFTEEADGDSLNQAALLSDGIQIRIPSKNSAESSGSESFSDGKVNLNTATKEELMTLPGIGESKAEAILEYREKEGLFRSLEELMNVSGIGSGIYNKLRDKIGI